jgi:cytoplasmic iron level regulating protein YaaA (DUF328/UPF0246 family)
MVSKLPVILLPPSEGKASGGDGPAWALGSMELDLDDSRLEVLDAVARAMKQTEAARAKLLGVKGKALASATAANRGARRAPTMPAIERYTGVLYDALDHGSLSAAHRRRLDGSVLILSGLWGAVAPSDPIPDYKLKMGASLPKLGKVSMWWRDELSDRLLQRSAGGRIWNLLPNEHAEAWHPREATRQWSVRFLEHRSDGSLVAVSHRNKSLKGALVRFLLANPGAGPDDLADWRASDFRFDPSLTEERDGITRVSLVERRGPRTR